VTSLIAWQWRWCYALSSIKTQHKIISAKHEKVTLLVRTNSQIKTRFNTKTAIALHTWRTTQKSQVHNCTSHSTITIKHNRALKIFKCFPAYLGLSKIGGVPIWGKTYRVTIWFSHNSKHETLQRCRKLEARNSTKVSQETEGCFLSFIASRIDKNHDFFSNQKNRI